MTPQQADDLARRIVNVWRSTPPIAEWRDVLQPLLISRALDVFETLRDSVELRLPIARFRTEYLAATRRADEQRSDGTSGPPMSLDEYLRRHPDDELARWREQLYAAHGIASSSDD